MCGFYAAGDGHDDAGGVDGETLRGRVDGDGGNRRIWIGARIPRVETVAETVGDLIGARRVRVPRVETVAVTVMVAVGDLVADRRSRRCRVSSGGEVKSGRVADPRVRVARVVVERGWVDVDVIVGTREEGSRRVDRDGLGS